MYIKTLQTVTQQELASVGYRAQDLALLAQNIPTAPAIVLQSNGFDDTVRQNSLKYKIDYILTHAQEHIPSTLQNAYNGCRKAFLEAKLPAGLESELKENYERLTAPLAIGELTTSRAAVRVIVSINRIMDPENNETVIQYITSFEELLNAIREAWALAYHPSELRDRLHEKFIENRLKVALIMQIMDEPNVSCFAYSCLPKDHHKTYLQMHVGYADLLNKIEKDFYAIGKRSFGVLAREYHQQTNKLVPSEKALVLSPITTNKEDKVNERTLLEIARLTRKAERLLLTPVKCLFTIQKDTIELQFANRLGFDAIISQEEPKVEIIEKPVLEVTEETTIRVEVKETLVPQAPEILTTQVAAEAQEASADDFIVPQEGVAAKLLKSSLQIVRQIVERKYRSAFGETPATETIADMINRLNQASTFSRPVDGALLLQAEQAANKEGKLTQEEYAKTISEVAYIMTYA